MQSQFSKQISLKQEVLTKSMPGLDNTLSSTIFQLIFKLLYPHFNFKNHNSTNQKMQMKPLCLGIQLRVLQKTLSQGVQSRPQQRAAAWTHHDTTSTLKSTGSGNCSDSKHEVLNMVQVSKENYICNYVDKWLEDINTSE